MALKFFLKITFPLYLFFFFAIYALDEDFHDFYYQADLVIDMERSLLGRIGDLFTGSEIEEDILSLRTFSEQNKRVSNLHALSDRLNADISEIHKKAHNLGFYDAAVKYKTHVLDNNKLLITIFVDFGQIFKLKLNINYINKNKTFRKEYSEKLKDKVANLTASISDMKQLITEAIRDLQKNGYYNPEVKEKRVWLNYVSKEAVLNLTIDPGKKVNFSKATISAFPDINPEFIENRIAWQEGELFNIEKLEQTSENLYATQIFSRVKVEPDKKSITDTEVPILISVKEDKKHTVDLSLLYSGMRSMNFEKKSNTNKRLKSIIGRISWTNCNAFGNGEKLKFTIEGTPVKVKERRTDYAFEAALVQPDVFIKNNTAEYIASRRQELTNVFFKKNDKISVLFSYPIWFFSAVRSGCVLERNYVDSCEEFTGEEDERKRYEDIIVPIEFILDRTDDMLNPTQGYRAFASYSYIKLKHAKINNLHTTNAGFSYNLPLDDLKKTIFALNIEDRMIFGKEIDDIPLDKRVYAGGMASVRGYANQMATDAVVGRDTVMGGKSALEFNTELRRKFSKDFGGVIFFDGAKVFQNRSRYSDMQIEKKRWFHSVGFGIRYFTSVGPIRADFAFPIRRRKGIDSKMQFILSLGQAF